ncbi:MAG: signal peptidase I [Spirochaetales bacterium]|nr:signal peptidase I [Spirochaetales bacterium]
MKQVHHGRIIIISIFILTILAKMFFIDISKIKGHSMEPNLHKNQVIFINSMAYGLQWPIIKEYIVHWAQPRPGDVVVVRDPRENKELVKRCVGVAGDLWTIEEGYLKVRGCSYPLIQYSYLLLEERRRVPVNHILVVGDNYEDSIDSRTFGYIEWNDILGRVMGSYIDPCTRLTH